MKRSKIRIILFSLLLLASVFLISTFFYLYASLRKSSGDVITSRNFHVVVLGQAENLSFLQKVFEGADRTSQNYNAVVELHVPSSQAEDSNLLSLMEYASFVNADGIIAYIDSESPVFDRPERLTGDPIPIVTLGTFNPAIPQISFLGTNYSELGRELAYQTIDAVGNQGRVLITGLDGSNNPTYSTLMNSLMLTLRQNTSITYEVLNSEEAKNEVEINILLKDKENPVDAVVCLTEEESISFARIMTSLKDERDIKLICYGENETISQYYDKNIISTIVAVDPIKTGSQAMLELFEYRNTGYTNSYINAPLMIRKKQNGGEQ